MENKQTAVNWLIKNLMLNGLIRRTQGQHSIYKELTEEAKAMERQQIMKAYGQGIADEAGEILDATKDAQQYYNETYTND